MSLTLWTVVGLRSVVTGGSCLNSLSARRELRRGAVEFTSGGQGLCFCLFGCSASIWAALPQEYADATLAAAVLSMCNDKLVFCQTECRHNRRKKGPLRRVVTLSGV